MSDANADRLRNTYTVMSNKNPASAAAGGSASSWRNPSVANMLRYGLNNLPEDFEPTPQEQVLLDMYENVRQYERQAKRLKEETARRKIEASQAAFEQKQAPKKKRKRRRPEVADAGGEAEGAEPPEDEESDAAEDEEMSEEEEEMDEQEKFERREAKIEKLRKEVEERQMKQSQEEYNPMAPVENEDDDDLAGVSLTRKNKAAVAPSASLISNLKAAATPPHDFSSSFELTRGEVLFPTEDIRRDEFWTPPDEKRISHPSEGALQLYLENFDLQMAENGTGPNTIAVKFKAPQDSKRFSMNVAFADEHNNFESILFHFNPRQRERGGQLVINDKSEGTWGQAINIPLSQLPMIFGQTSCTLLVQINSDGFDIFIEKEHCARLEHRTPFPSGRTRLVVQFPSSDDYGSPERWTVFRVWWGVRSSMAKKELAGVAGVNIYSAEHPRKLIIRGLPRIHTVSDVDVRRAELERAFRKYGGDRGVTVVVPVRKTFAFVEMETERKADLALTEMSHIYQLGRARRSKHEALQEERASKEAGNAKGAKGKGY